MARGPPPQIVVAFSTSADESVDLATSGKETASDHGVRQLFFSLAGQDEHLTVLNLFAFVTYCGGKRICRTHFVHLHFRANARPRRHTEPDNAMSLSHTEPPTPQKRSSARTVIVENSVCRHLVKPYSAGRLSLKNHIDGNDMVMAFKHMSCELKMIFVFKFVHK